MYIGLIVAVGGRDHEREQRLSERRILRATVRPNGFSGRGADRRW